MKRLTRFLPLYTLLAGAGCALLRFWLYTGLDEKGLIPNGHPATFPLTVLSVLSALIFVLGYLWEKDRDPRIRTVFPVQAIGCIAAAAGLGYWCAANPGASRLFGAACLIAAGSFLILSFFRFTAKKPPLVILAALNIAFLILCFAQYRQWGTYTQLQGYLFPACSALFLALYSLQHLLLELPEQSHKKAFFLNQAALLSCLVCLSTENWPYYLCMTIWLISCQFTKPCVMKLPADVLHCIRSLEQAGFSAYAVGGCVRDAMLGLTPHDYDLCTNAKPEDICRVFANYSLIRAGEKHGTIGVLLHHKVYEITTYRMEGTYADNRHPDSVTFVDRIEEDLARRDFTVNAMAYHPVQGYLDPFGGENDLFDGILRTVGEPEARFREDALRILRGMRFACRFHLQPEKKTLQAMRSLSPLLDNLARERVCSEMTQILCVADDQQLLQYTPVILRIIPELTDCVGFAQHNPHHKHDIFTHTAKAVANVEADPALRWAALLHDIGKPQVFSRDEKGVGHFHGHAGVSAELANDILHRLKVSNELREQVVFLIRHHMDQISVDKAVLRRKLSKYGADNLTKLIRLQQADCYATGTAPASAERRFEKLLLLTQQLQQEEGCLQIRDLAVNGHDLMELGFAPGPKLGACQKYLLEQVLSETVPNEKNALMQKAQEFLKQ